MTIERTYNVPLRRGFRLTARYKKTKKAVTVLKEFLAQHMKTDLDKIKIGKNLNKELCKHGIKNPPHHVKVTVIKDDDGIVKTELIGFKYEHKKKDQKEEKQKPEDKKEPKEEKKRPEIKPQKKSESIKDQKKSESIKDDTPKAETKKKSEKIEEKKE